MINKVYFFSILVLVLYKIIAIFFTEFNLFSDEAQYWLWSQSVDFGYYSKPPLLAWFIAGYTKILGNDFITLKIFPIIVYFFISFAVYVLCLKVNLSKKNSLACSLSFLILPAVSFSSFLISTDLLLLLFWTLSMITVLQLRNCGSNINFLLLGLFLGLTFLAKYAAVYFLICLFILLVVDKKTLQSFKKNPLGVVIFLGSLLLVLSPNIFWNINNGWATLNHTSDNANLQNLNINFYNPLMFTLSQLLMVGPIITISSILLIKRFNFDFENKFLLIFFIPIFIIVLIESLLVRANANWAAPALISFFILLFRHVEKEKPFMIKLNFIVNYFIAVLLFSAILVSSRNSVFDRIRGIETFSKKILLVIKNSDLAISDRMVFSSLSYEFRNKKNNLYMIHQSDTPITNHFQITSSLKKNIGNDFYFIGEMSDVFYLSKNNKINHIKGYETTFSSSVLNLYEVNFK